jgi:hypothetical protein
MSQKSSLTQSAHFVRQVLTAYTAVYTVSDLSDHITSIEVEEIAARLATAARIAPDSPATTATDTPAHGAPGHHH